MKRKKVGLLMQESHQQMKIDSVLGKRVIGWNTLTIRSVDTAEYMAKKLHVQEITGVPSESLVSMVTDNLSWLSHEVVIGLSGFIPSATSDQENAVGDITPSMYSPECIRHLSEWSGVDIASLLP